MNTPMEYPFSRRSSNIVQERRPSFEQGFLTGKMVASTSIPNRISSKSFKSRLPSDPVGATCRNESRKSLSRSVSNYETSTLSLSDKLLNFSPPSMTSLTSGVSHSRTPSKSKLVRKKSINRINETPTTAASSTRIELVGEELKVPWKFEGTRKKIEEKDYLVCKGERYPASLKRRTSTGGREDDTSSSSLSSHTEHPWENEIILSMLPDGDFKRDQTERRPTKGENTGTSQASLISNSGAAAFHESFPDKRRASLLLSPSVKGGKLQWNLHGEKQIQTGTETRQEDDCAGFDETHTHGHVTLATTKQPIRNTVTGPVSVSRHRSFQGKRVERRHSGRVPNPVSPSRRRPSLKEGNTRRGSLSRGQSPPRPGSLKAKLLNSQD